MTAKWDNSKWADDYHRLIDETGKLIGIVICPSSADGLWDAHDARKRPYIDLGQFVSEESAKAAVEAAMRGEKP